MSNGHQDSLEILCLFLASLNEDLKYNDKSVALSSSSNPQIINREDPKLILSLLTNHESSIITDLFYGLTKTKIRCPGCKNTFFSYDPFLFLPLSIPEKGTSKIKFKVFADNYDYNYFFVEIYDLPKTFTIKQIKRKIKEFNQHKSKEFDALLLENKKLISILPDDELVYDYVYTKFEFTDEEFKDMEIIFYQVENSSDCKNKGDYVTFYVSPCNFFDEQYYLFFKYKDFKPLGYPKAFSISKKGRVKDLYIEIYKYYRRVMDDRVIKSNEDSNMNTSYYENFYENITNKTIIEKDFNKYYLGIEDNKNSDIDNLNIDNTNVSSENSLFELHLFNNIPPSTSYFYRKPTCEFCNKNNCIYCKIKFSFDTKIYELFVTQKTVRPFIILADFSKFKTNFFKFYEEFVDNDDPISLFRGELTLFDCLDKFRKEEKLEKENPWYCEKCDKNQEAFKQVEIYEAPKYLIIQFKRFKLKGHKSLVELVNNKKNESFIYYPENNLDLNNYVIGPNNEDAKYELVAINQHTGGLTGGHYTSLAKNNGKWYEFNDDIITEANFNKVINLNSYYLIYKKVSNKKTENTEMTENELLNANFSINK